MWGAGPNGSSSGLGSPWETPSAWPTGTSCGCSPPGGSSCRRLGADCSSRAGAISVLGWEHYTPVLQMWNRETDEAMWNRENEEEM